MAQPATTESGKPESMEEILQSIKRIIEDDTGEKTAPAAAKAEADVLDLTEVITPEGAPAPAPVPPKAAVPPPAAAAVPLPAPPLKPAEPAVPPSADVVKSIDAMLAPEPPKTATPEPAPPPAPAPAPPKPEPAAAPAPPPKPAPAPAPAAEALTVKPIIMEDALVSEEATRAAAASLKSIAESAPKDFSIPRIDSPGLRGGSTVEDLILEALRPMLKAWLDENLPVIVQKIVEKEVKRLVNFHKD